MGPVGQQRSWLVVLLLSIVTFGIYAIYWQYATFKEMKDHSGQGIGGGIGLLLAILTGFVNAFLMPSEVNDLYVRSGRTSEVSLATGFWVFLPLIGGLIWLSKTQNALNAYWECAAGSTPPPAAPATAPF